MGDYTQTSYTISEPVWETPRPTRRSRDKILIIILAIIGLILVGFLVYLLLDSTGNKDGGNNAGPNLDESKNVRLQWWGVFLDEEIVQPLIDEYQAQHENVTIEYANKWSTASRDNAAEVYQSEINRVLAQNNPVEIPDIFMVHNSWVGDYERYVKPSNSYDINTFNSAFYDVVVSDFSRNSTVLGVPLWIDTLAVLYNKDMLASMAVSTPPANWTDFKDLAEALTKKSGSTITQGGFAAGTSKNITYSAEILNLLLMQNGVQIVNSNGQLTFSEDTDSLAALNFYKSFASGGDVTWNTTFKTDAASFLEKKVAMIVSSSWRYRDIHYFNNIYDLGIKIGVAPMPQIQGQETVNWSDYWGNMVALNRPNSDYAWDFLKWISQPEQLRKLNQNTTTQNNLFGPLYPRKDMSQDLENDEFLKVYNASLPSAKNWNMVKGQQIKKEFNKLIDAGASASQIAAAENAMQELIDQKGEL